LDATSLNRTAWRTIIGAMITSSIHVLIITPVSFYIMKMRAMRGGRLKLSGMPE